MTLKEAVRSKQAVGCKSRIVLTRRLTQHLCCESKLFHQEVFVQNDFRLTIGVVR